MEHLETIGSRDDPMELDSHRLPALVVQLTTAQLEGLIRGVVRDEVAAALEQVQGPTNQTDLQGELEPLLTASQLSKILNCGVRTLKRWLQEGVAPPPLETPGSRLRWQPSAVRRWLRERSVSSGELPFDSHRATG